MTHITGFFHGGITVKDMEQSLKFYRDGLQLEVEFDVLNDKDYLREVVGVSFSAIRIVYLRIPNSGFIELLEYQGADRKSASARPSDFGGGHLCLYVDDIEAIATRLHLLGYASRSKAPVNIVAGPNIGARVIYMQDPDGYFIELFQKPSKS